MALSHSKKISTLFRRIPSRHVDYFYCLNCLLPLRNIKKPHKKVFEDKFFCDVFQKLEDIRI